MSTDRYISDLAARILITYESTLTGKDTLRDRLDAMARTVSALQLHEPGSDPQCEPPKLRTAT
jgi:hypothetical protein